MSSASAVSYIALQFNRYAPIPVLIFGFIGNIFNILIFTRPSLVKNPCSTYFLFLSFINLSVLVFGQLARFLNDGFAIDLVSYNLPFCRIRYYLLHPSMALQLWYTILAGIDRYCISSRDANRRQFSNLKYSRYLAVLTTLIVLVIYSHVLVLFTIEQLKSGPYCYAQAGTYRVFYDFFYFATYSFTPPIIIIIVGFATLRNIHQTRAQISTTGINPTNGNQLRKRDRQLIKMLLVQFVCTVILTLPLAIQKLYTTFTQNDTKDAYRVAIESFVVQITRVLAFSNCCTSFFVFTPSIVMIIVGLGTFYNIHQIQAQVTPQATNQTYAIQLRKRDRQLIKMLLVQFIFTVILTLPIAIQKLYITFTQNMVKDSYQVAAENFVAQLMRVFTFINSSSSFYVFIISGSGFRYEFGQIIMHVIKYLFGENSRFYRRIQRFIEVSSVVEVETIKKTATTLNIH